MIEIVLLIVIVALVSLIGWIDFNNRKERKSMLNAILAKDTQELINLELTDKTKIEAKTESKPSDLIETSEIPDDDYIKLITDNG